MLPRVLLASDVHDWSFAQNQRDLAAALAGRFEFAHWHVVDYLRDRRTCPDMSLYDAVYVLFHRWKIAEVLPWDRALGALRSRWFVAEKPGLPTEADVNLVNRHRAFQVCVRACLDELGGRCPGAVYLTNPVDCSRFPLLPHRRERVVASWNGNARHVNAAGVDVKAFRSIVQPACAAAGVPLVYAEYHTKRLRAEEMPAFYREADVAVCASLYEGASNSAMEAMAAGQALVTTDCGNVAELRSSQLEHLGEAGILVVDRAIGAVAEALRELAADPARVRRMGELNRAELFERWSWAAWADRYEAFLRMAL